MAFSFSSEITMLRSIQTLAKGRAGVPALLYEEGEAARTEKVLFWLDKRALWVDRPCFIEG